MDCTLVLSLLLYELYFGVDVNSLVSVVLCT